MKKFFYIAATFLQSLFLISAYMIQYFSMKRMGMMRYVVYKNQTLQSQYPILVMQHAAMAFLVLLTVISLVFYSIKRNNGFGKMALPMLAFQVVLTGLFVFFTLAYSTSSYRSYYFICLILALTSLIQGIKVIAYLIIKNV